jgi:peptidyl-prolyl cis-trans isomerase SurA
MTIQELQRGMVNRRITITQQEINNFLNSQMGREMIAADYFLEHVLIPISAGDSADVLEKKSRSSRQHYF